LSVEVFRAARATLGEGPCWVPDLDALVWVDILQRRVHVSTREATRSYPTPAHVSAAVPRAGGGLLLAMGCSFATLDLDDGSVEVVAQVPGDPELLRMNDGATDPAGRFWAGTMAYDETPGAGALYRLDGPGAAARVLERVTISNGVGWSPDGERMFYVDTPTRTVVAFAFDAGRGSTGPSAVHVDTSAFAGVPDGLSVDAEGNLWVAFWDGAAVRCFSGADGTLLEEIAVPVTRPTSCAFGGRGLRELLITTAREGLSDAQLAGEPLAGSVLAVTPGVAGLPPVPAVLQPAPEAIA
jgi:sugar lactone lactonase YvrE